MSFYQGLQAETVSFRGHNGDQGEAYYARPTRAGRAGRVQLPVEGRTRRAERGPKNAAKVLRS